jgi:hypothetical protein
MEREMNLDLKKYVSLKLIETVNSVKGKSQYKVAVKAVDIFGNDTMKIIEVSV